MTEHLDIITPELLSMIIGLIVMIGGGTAVGIIVALRKWLLKGINVATLLAKALEDGQLSPAEIKGLWDALLKSLENNPDTPAAKALLNSKKD